jgi:hypothetical protein
MLRRHLHDLNSTVLETCATHLDDSPEIQYGYDEYGILAGKAVRLEVIVRGLEQSF